MLTINILEKLMNHNILVYDSNAQYDAYLIVGVNKDYTDGILGSC